MYGSLQKLVKDEPIIMCYNEDKFFSERTGQTAKQWNSAADEEQRMGSGYEKSIKGRLE